jgi:hypothetical protein
MGLSKSCAQGHGVNKLTRVDLNLYLSLFFFKIIFSSLLILLIEIDVG